LAARYGPPIIVHGGADMAESGISPDLDKLIVMTADQFAPSLFFLQRRAPSAAAALIPGP